MPGWINRWARQLRHRFVDRDATHALPADARERIAQAITASEALHTGQIRVYVATALPWSYIRRDAPVRERALMEFSKLRVWDTEHNNGVLIYLLLADHAIEIVADRALARCVDSAQWKSIIGKLSANLHGDSYEQALLAAVEQVSALLTQQFPRTGDALGDNELPDAPVVR